MILATLMSSVQVEMSLAQAEAEVRTSPDVNDPLWQEMEQLDDGFDGVKVTAPTGGDPVWEEGEVAACLEDSKKNWLDSGLGLSLLSTPGNAYAQGVNLVNLDVSRESGEISEDEVPAVPQADTEDYNTVKYYTARSLAERLVFDNQPAPVLWELKLTPVSSATMITDRVVTFLTQKDRVVFMQNNVVQDYWQLSKLISDRQVEIRGFRYVIVQIGLDWCLTMKKAVLKESLLRPEYGSG